MRATGPGAGVPGSSVTDMGLRMCAPALAGCCAGGYHLSDYGTGVPPAMKRLDQAAYRYPSLAIPYLLPAARSRMHVRACSVAEMFFRAQPQLLHFYPPPPAHPLPPGKLRSRAVAARHRGGAQPQGRVGRGPGGWVRVPPWKSHSGIQALVNV